MVLAELAGGVAEVEQELGQRRRAGLQEGRAAGQLRRDHAGAQRRHAGEEGGAPGRAALLGVIGHELRTFIADAVDVRRFADHQTLMVDARLHPADVVAHDEHDVGFTAFSCASAGEATNVTAANAVNRLSRMLLRYLMVFSSICTLSLHFGLHWFAASSRRPTPHRTGSRRDRRSQSVESLNYSSLLMSSSLRFSVAVACLTTQH